MGKKEMPSFTKRKIRNFSPRKINKIGKACEVEVVPRPLVKSRELGKEKRSKCGFLDDSVDQFCLRESLKHKIKNVKWGKLGVQKRTKNAL